MKVFTFLMLAIVMHVSASSYSQTTRLTLNMKDASIKDVLSQIEEQTEYRFLYSDSKINVENKVNIDVSQRTIEDILNEVFAGTGVHYKVIDRQILLSKDLNSDLNQVSQQEVKVSGKVVDTSGAPLPGVTIVVKGTTNGTITDPDGNYT
ncbi:MAG TPA: secretin and TonB N-terminal domain-containing protein, partial [Sunxiuqinia sp.]|nr:secretin and TonB N-terminal domain-containing protein [Sunxiuqinia sp.]